MTTTFKNHTLKRLLHVRSWNLHYQIQTEIHPLIRKQQRVAEKIENKIGANLTCVNPEIQSYLTA